MSSRILRVFPRRTALTPTDDLAVIGYPRLELPSVDEVHVSCTFTWDQRECEQLRMAWQQYYPVVLLGGPAYSSHGPFIPGRYVREGVTFTSRGCNNHCPWCLVPIREGKLVEKADFSAGNIIQDNNFLQTSQAHQDRVMAMLRTQRQIQFSGGLDARLVTEAFAESLRSLKLYQLFLACDTERALTPLRRAVALLKLSRDKVRCFVLMAHNGQTPAEAETLCWNVWEAGAMPFAQLYQPPDKWIEYSQEWRHLQRLWARPAIIKARALREVWNE